MDEPTNKPQDDVRPVERSTQRPADMGANRQPAQDGTATGGFDLNNPTIISLLYLGSWVTGVTGIVGIVLAHVWQGDAAEWERSHYTYLIRTFWFGFLGAFVGALLTIVLIGFLILPAVAIWVAVRSVMSLIKAQKQEPMPDPETLLF